MGLRWRSFPALILQIRNEKPEERSELLLLTAHCGSTGAGLSGQEASLGQGPPWSAGVILPLTLWNIWHCLGTFLVVTPAEEGNCSAPYGAPDGRPSKE